MVTRHRLTVQSENPTGIRVDRFVSEQLRSVSRNQLQRRLSSLTVNGRPGRLSRRLRRGDVIEIELLEEPPLKLEPQEVPFIVLYDGEHVLVVDKPSGVVVHPGDGNWDGTLVHGLLNYVQQKAFGEDDVRPGVVHRLDKETSGVMVWGKSPAARDALTREFAERRVEKVYIALTRGLPPKGTGTIRGYLRRDTTDRKRFVSDAADTRGGKYAETFYRVLEHNESWALVALYPTTGRTHQLRVHMRSLGCSIVGDALYGPGRRARQEAKVSEGLMLHAYRLSIRLPGESGARSFTAPIPDRLRAAVEARALSVPQAIPDWS